MRKQMQSELGKKDLETKLHDLTKKKNTLLERVILVITENRATQQEGSRREKGTREEGHR